MADSKNGSSTAKSQKFRWEDEDIERLINLYEARPCQWDIADPTYSKRDVREKTLFEIKEELGIEINTIESRGNFLRAQHRRELAKESKTKSVQSTGDVYESSWPFMEKMRRTSQKDSQKHLNFKTFRPTISHRRREQAGR